MNENSVAEALRALVISGSKKSETARLRLVFDEIELAFASGVSRETMLATLHAQGFTMALRGFDSAMHRLRKEHKNQQPVGPDKREQGRVHASETARSPAAMPQSVTPKEEAEDQSNLTLEERREKRADKFIKPEASSLLLKTLLKDKKP